ncbi:Response regulator of zinc sigma-54-dependent two-component system [Olavius algarvensis Delta 1 endosymbiont]|nr:Response regulator of zinc sigma-54-dependent two-component system [Olavius algarvensis Delta 1 endosymbiont]
MTDPNLQLKNKVIPIKIQSQVIFKDIIGHGSAMQKIFRIVEKVAASDTTIMLNGETGTGKGLIARAIHLASGRKEKPFVQINCGATPEGLLESEFFGYRRGAFTGATADKAGKFEMAKGGTIFLDEIGDMSADLQVKVLRVLEEGEFERVGGHETIKSDARIIAATHRDLEEEVQKGNFREDLFYRLYVIPVMLPTLKERQGDIPYLVSYFLEEFRPQKEDLPTKISDRAMKILVNYSWPGNVRELRNLIERLVVLNEGEEILPEDLPEKLQIDGGRKTQRKFEVDGEGISFNTAVSEFEKALIISALEKTNWVKNKAAQLLKIKRTTLVEKIKRYKLGKDSGPDN